MRNLDNAIKAVNSFKGKLSRSIVCYTAKQSLNQYSCGWIKPKTSDSAEAIEALGILELLEQPLKGRKLDEELTRKGINWLNSFLFKKNGEPRSNKALQGVSSEVFKAVKEFSHFTFEGFQENCSGYYCTYTPIWGIHSKSGSQVNYSYAGWQNGGCFESWVVRYSKTK